MTRFHQDFEHYPNGTTITPANGGSATSRPFDFVSYGAGTLVASTSSPLVGSVSAVVTGGTATAYPQWDIPAGKTRWVLRMAFRYPANPTSTFTLMEIRTASAQAAGLAVSTTGFLVAQIAGVTVSGSSSSGAFTMVAGTLYYLELYVSLESAPGAADGTIGYRITRASDNVVVREYNGTAKATGTAALAVCRYAATKSTGSGYTTAVIDEVDAGDPTGWLGPYVASPTANAGPDQSAVAAYSTVTLSGAGSLNPGGGALTYAWTQTGGTTVTLTGGTTVAPTFTAPATLAGTTLTFSLTVTSGGQTSDPDTVSVTVPPHPRWRRQGGTLHPLRFVP